MPVGFRQAMPEASRVLVDHPARGPPIYDLERRWPLALGDLAESGGLALAHAVTDSSTLETQHIEALSVDPPEVGHRAVTSCAMQDRNVGRWPGTTGWS